MKILITVEYFGKNYAGWQRQKNANSVQQVLEEKLSQILQTEITLWGSGRTDRGVHALGQKAHFVYYGKFPIDRLCTAVNSLLPDDIRLFDAKIVDDDFHAQYGAKRKTYMYKYYVGRTLHPIKNELAAQIPYDESMFDFSKMQEACSKLIGTHDFAGFSATGSKVKSTIRTIYSATLTKDGQDVTLEICGNGFLYNMVRIIAGTLAYVAIGKLTLSVIEEIFITKDRTKAGKTYPPQGLYLKSVEYDFLG